jgi:hypothetical protein
LQFWHLIHWEDYRLIEVAGSCRIESKDVKLDLTDLSGDICLQWVAVVHLNLSVPPLSLLGTSPLFSRTYSLSAQLLKAYCLARPLHRATPPPLPAYSQCKWDAQFQATFVTYISYPCNRPWRPVGLWDVEVPTFCLDSRLTDGGKVVSPTHRPLFTLQEGSWYSFLLEAESTPGP